MSSYKEPASIGFGLETATETNSKSFCNRNRHQNQKFQTETDSKYFCNRNSIFQPKSTYWNRKPINIGKNSSIESFRHMVKMSLFVKLDNFNMKNMDEFSQVWVLTHQNLFIWCKITCLIPWTMHCNDLLTSKNSMKIT